MLWYVLSFIGAIADAGYYISVKKFLQTSDPFSLAAGGYTCTGTVLLLMSWIMGFPDIGQDFYGSLFASSVLGIGAILLTFAALRSTDISLAVPMISFTPLFLIVTAFVILHEVPTMTGIAGIVIIVTGSYVLNLSSSDGGWTDPFRSVFRNRGVLYMLMVSVIYAFAINFDKIIVNNSDPVFGASIICMILGLSFAGISQIPPLKEMLVRITGPVPDSPLQQSLPDGATPSNKRVRQWIAIGILLSVSAVSIYTAYTLQIVPYVIAIKRMSIIIIVFYGGFVFREKEMLRRFSGALLMVAGAVMIVLFN